MSSHFADRLAAAVLAKKTPLVVGLDPRWELLPDGWRDACRADDVRQVAAACGEFCRLVIDVVAPLVPAVKPQWAFFEQWGSMGIAELERVLAHARSSGLLIVGDAKRGDIGSTAEAYAAAYLGTEGPLRCDALTINPYLGADSWAPFLAAAKSHGGGVFLLVKTSNRGSGDLQDLAAPNQPVYEIVADQVERAAAETKGQHGYGIVGAVVGATYPQQLTELRQRMPSAWILVPGFGAQGGTAADVAPAFGADSLGAIVNSSRAILGAHREPQFASGSHDWQAAIEAACRDSIDQLRAAVSIRS